MVHCPPPATKRGAELGAPRARQLHALVRPRHGTDRCPTKSGPKGWIPAAPVQARYCWMTAFAKIGSGILSWDTIM